MAITIVVPRLGWSMDEGTFGEWLKQDRDVVEPGEMLFTLEGDKATQEVECFDAGILHIPATAPKSGETVVVGQLLAYLLAEGESPPTPSGAPEASVAQPPPLARPTASKRAAGPAARRRARQLGVDLDVASTPDPTGRVVTQDLQPATARPSRSDAPRARVAASPRARRRARELGVPWDRIAGTGRNGRVRERDVVQFSRRNLQDASDEVPPTAPGTQKLASSTRRTIARRLQQASQSTVPVTLTTKIHATRLVAFREQCKASSTPAPSYQDILVYLVAKTLPECPELNACWYQNNLFLYDQINLGIAVQTDSGLLAPVLRDADQLSLDAITAQSRHLIELARSGRLVAEQLRDGTFTITNLGSFDIDFFTPTLNPPQSAILGIGRIAREPVLRGDDIVVGATMCLSLTFDHRVLDGAPAARWLQSLARKLASIRDLSEAT